MHHVSHFNAFSELASESFATGSETNRIVQGIAQQLNKVQLSDEEHRILDWLSPLPDPSRSTGERDRRQTGTGTWFLQTPEYVSWRNGTSPTLLCPGIPGAGKTVMSTFVIDDLWQQYGTRADIGILNLFCNFRLTSEQTLVKLLSSLVRQAVERLPAVPAELHTLHDEHERRQTRPSSDQLLNTLSRVVESTTRTYIVLDALDECRNDDRTLDRLLELVFSVQTQLIGKVSLLATTRFIPGILDQFMNVPRLEIRADDVDVRRYLDSQMNRLPRQVATNVAFCTEIKDKIVECVDGM